MKRLAWFIGALLLLAACGSPDQAGQGNATPAPTTPATENAPTQAVTATADGASTALPSLPDKVKPLVEQAIDDLAQRQKMSRESIMVLSVEERTWPSPQLGCGGANMDGDPVPGFLIMLDSQGQAFEYHASLTRVIWCDKGRM